MRMAVLGATGMVGSAIVTEALGRGHHVTALSRHPVHVHHHDHLVSRSVDLFDAESIDPALEGHEVVVLSVRLPPGQESRLASVTREVLDAAARRDLRVLVVGGSAPLRSPNSPDQLVIDDPEFVPEAWKQIARASLDQFRACAVHPSARWVYLSPPALLEVGERTGRYRRGTTRLLTNHQGISRISAADLAIAALDELERPGQDRHVTVGEAPATA